MIANYLNFISYNATGAHKNRLYCEKKIVSKKFAKKEPTKGETWFDLDYLCAYERNIITCKNKTWTSHGVGVCCDDIFYYWGRFFCLREGKSDVCGSLMSCY